MPTTNIIGVSINTYLSVDKFNIVEKFIVIRLDKMAETVPLVSDCFR